jgi:hypothetical protein
MFYNIRDIFIENVFIWLPITTVQGGALGSGTALEPKGGGFISRYGHSEFSLT